MEKIEHLLQEQNDLLRAILEELQEGLHIKRESNGKKYAYRTPLTQDDYNSLDEEIDLEWWFQTFKETPLPAKYMNQSGIEYSKQEKDYMYRRLLDISSVTPAVNNGTHVFRYLGKIWCKEEKNALNCFACVPVE